MSMILDGSNGVTFNDASLQGAAASPYVLKNRIINGDMVIDQRNAGASVSTSSGTRSFSVDRWSANFLQTDKFTVQQNAGAVTPPVGFINYIGATSSSAYSVLSTDIFNIQQQIEGFNVADLAWGTANAKTVALSFWVRSSLTGTFGGVLRNSDNDRSYPYTYTISVANTWELKSVTVAGDTSGTWLTNSSTGLRLIFSLGAGSDRSGTAGAWAGANYNSATGATSVVGTNGATWYVTGVQLEQNTSATPFERRLYGQELANCQRYCEVQGRIGTRSIAAFGFYETTTTVNCVLNYTQKRATPTVTVTNGGGSANSFASSQATSTINTVTAGSIQTNLCLIGGAVASGTFTAGLAGYLEWRNVNAYALIEAEL
jgi:hypothetical protein